MNLDSSIDGYADKDEDDTSNGTRDDNDGRANEDEDTGDNNDDYADEDEDNTSSGHGGTTMAVLMKMKMMIAVVIVMTKMAVLMKTKMALAVVMIMFSDSCADEDKDGTSCGNDDI